MKRKQIMALILSAILSISSCVPTGIQAYAAESAAAGATSAESAAQVEFSEQEAEVTADEQILSTDVPNVGEDLAEVIETDEQDNEPDHADDDQDSQIMENNTADDNSANNDAQESVSEEQGAVTKEDGTSDQAEGADTEISDRAATDETAEEEVAQAADEAGDDDALSEPADAAETEEAEATETEAADVIEEGIEVEDSNQAALAAPTASDFENAIEISVGDAIEVSVNNENPYAYLKFTPQETKKYVFYSSESEWESYDTYGTLYNASYSQLYYDDDGGDDSQFLIEATLFAGVSYYLQARLYYTSSSGSFIVNLEASDSEIGDFYLEGRNGTQTVECTPGDPVTLSVNAYASSELTYTWYDGNGNTIGDNTPEYTLTPDCKQRIRCSVSSDNGSGYVYFNLVLNHFAVHPENAGDGNNSVYLDIVAGSPAVLRAIVEADDSSGVTYKWYESLYDPEDGSYGAYIEIENAGTAEYNIDAVTSRKLYRCEVSDQYENSGTIYFYTNVDNALKAYTIYNNEKSTYKYVYVSPKSTAALAVTVEATDTTGIKYVWYDDDYNVIEGANTASYSVDSVTETGNYRCVVSDQYGNSATVNFYIRIENHLNVYSDPEEEDRYYDVPVRPNEAAQLKVYVSADDMEDLTYRWYKAEYDSESEWYGSSELIEGAETDELATDPITKRFRYSCEVRDPYGNYGTAYFYVYVENNLKVYTIDDGEKTDYKSIYVSPNGAADLEVFVEADDMTGIEYTWYDDYDVIEGANTGSYTVDPVTEAVSYECIVSDQYGNSESVNFYISVENHLTVFSDPEEEDRYYYISVGPNETAQLKVYVSADDMEGLTYRWRKSEYNSESGWYGSYVLIDGAVTDKLATGPITQKSRYECYVEDQYGNSEYAYIYVSIDNGLLAYPEGNSEDDNVADIEIKAEDTVTLKTVVKAKDLNGLKYIWRKNGSVLDGENTAQLADVGVSGTYYCTVEDAYGNTAQAYFYLTVDNAVEARQESNSAIYNGTRTVYTKPGEDVVLNVSATATYTESLTYAWYKNEWSEDEETIPDANGPSYTASGNEKATYVCKVSDKYGSAGYLQFNVAIDNNFTAYIVGSDSYSTWTEIGRQAAELRVTATADEGSIHYQWGRIDSNNWDAEDIEGATSDSYTLTEEDLKTKYSSVYCEVSDDYGNEKTLSFEYENLAAITAYPEGAYQYPDGSHRSWVDIYAEPAAEKITLNVIVENADPADLNFEWKELYNDEEIEENTSSIEVAKSNAEYRCIVSDSNGNNRYVYFYTYSKWLRAYADIEGLDHRSSATISLNPAQDYTMKVFAEGTDTESLTYEWYEGDKKITDAEGASLDIIAEKSIRYRCRVRNSSGYSSSVTFYIQVGTLEAYVPGKEPYNRYADGTENYLEYSYSLKAGVPVTLAAKGQSTPSSTISYAWRVDNDESETGSDSLTVTPEKSMFVSCKVSDEYGNVNWLHYYLYVNHFTVEGTRNNYYNPDTGDGCTLKVTVGGDDLSKVSYTWEQYPGNGRVLTVAKGTASIKVNPAYEVMYECHVDDGYGNERYVDFYVIPKSGLAAVPEGWKTGIYNQEANRLTIYAEKGEVINLKTIATVEGGSDVTYTWQSHELSLDTDLDENPKNGWSLVNSHNETFALTADGDTRYVCCVTDRYGNNAKVYFDVITSDVKIMSRCEIALSQTEFVYTGSQIKPTVTVKYKGTVLTSGKDYTVSYSSNTNVGQGVATVKGAGSFSGSVEKTFVISKARQNIKLSTTTVNKGSTTDITVSGAQGALTCEVEDPSIATATVSGTKITATGVKEGTTKLTVKAQGTDNYYPAEVTFELNVKNIVLGKTTRGDMFNLANNVKVTWNAVPGAKYYKVYREGVTDPKESRKEPVIVTKDLIGWDKEDGLTNGHAYRYKIVASLTGRGDSSGDSPLSYSKLMYRLKTVVIRSVKNTAAGKVTVKYDKTTAGDSYVLQYCDREDMVGAKTKVVLGANNTSYTIGGLKKGKTYYISIRVRKKVNGIDYYTTFGVAKKIKITQ